MPVQCGLMEGLVQRVTRAAVHISGRTVAQIETGLLVLVGVAKPDTSQDAQRLLERVLAYRLFSDDSGRMNRSLTDIGGGLLLVPNFTLMADTHKGTRPSFSPAAPPEQARALFEEMIEQAAPRVANLGAGVFGSDMQVELINDGPVTIRLSTRAWGPVAKDR